MKTHNETLRWGARHVPIDSGGYDSSGAYWGLGERLYRIAVYDRKSGDELSATHVRLYRADCSRVLALYARESFPEYDDSKPALDRFRVFGKLTPNRWYALALAREHAEAFAADPANARQPVKYDGFSGRTFHESSFESGAVSERTRALFERDA